MRDRGLRALYLSYGVRGMVRLVLDILSTRLFERDARLIRRPAYIRGRRFMQLGAGLTTGPALRLDAFQAVSGMTPSLIIGNGVEMNDYVHIAAVCSVFIGNRVLIASKVFITDHNHGCYKGPGPQDSPATPPAERPLTFAPVRIEDDVWIGESVAILPGVTIGRGAVLATASVVTRDVPPYTIVAGSPAKPIKSYDFNTQQWEPV